MVEITQLDLNVDRDTVPNSLDNFVADLEFTVEFSSDEQSTNYTYEVIGALVEVDDALDDYELDEETYTYRGRPLLTRTVLDRRKAEGAQDEIIGIIGEEAVSADVGRQTFHFSEALGRVGQEVGDGMHVFVGDSVDRELLDLDEYDEDDTLRIHTAELRAMVWIVPQDLSLAAFSGEGEQVKLYELFL